MTSVVVHVKERDHFAHMERKDAAPLLADAVPGLMIHPHVDEKTHIVDMTSSIKTTTTNKKRRPKMTAAARWKMILCGFIPPLSYWKEHRVELGVVGAVVLVLAGLIILFVLYLYPRDPITHRMRNVPGMVSVFLIACVLGVGIILYFLAKGMIPGEDNDDTDVKEGEEEEDEEYEETVIGTILPREGEEETTIVSSSSSSLTIIEQV